MNGEANKEKEIIITINNCHRHSQCPCCGSSIHKNMGKIKYNSHLLFSTKEIKILHQPQLYKCLACDSAFVQNAVTEDDARHLYNSGDADERWPYSAFTQAKTAVVIETLSNLLNQGVRVLDIGCSSGNWLDYAKRKGAKTTGVEYSDNTLDLIKQKGHKGFSDIKEVEGHYDIITAFDLVEHVYDVPGFIERCSQVLNPGGYLIFLTGDISCLPAVLSGSSWWYVKFPEHIVFPSRQYFQSLSWFELESCTSTYHSLSAQSYGEGIRNNLYNMTTYVLQNLLKKNT